MPEQFISVPVPADRVGEVYKLLSSPPNGTTSVKPEFGAKSSDDWTWLAEHTYEKHDWPIEVVRRAVVESNAGQRNFLKYLAERPGESLTTQQIAGGLKVERKDISGALSGLSRRAKSRYKLPVWFFRVQWDGAQCAYRMDEREAAVVLEAVGN